MKIVVKQPETLTLEQFAERHDLTMELTERPLEAWEGPKAAMDRWMARFQDTDVVDGSLLVGTCGNGPTQTEAMNDYAKKISGKKIAVDPFEQNGLRRDIWVPRLS